MVPHPSHFIGSSWYVYKSLLSSSISAMRKSMSLLVTMLDMTTMRKKFGGSGSSCRGMDWKPIIIEPFCCIRSLIVTAAAFTDFFHSSDMALELVKERMQQKGSMMI